MVYYPAPLKGSRRLAVITLRTRSGGHKLQEVQATLRGNMPVALNTGAVGGDIEYPIYEVLTVDGVVDVVEHRRLEPVFYMTDDSSIRRSLGLRP
jgi:DUF4097 and DUF4098 domain-containing protein YvlB